ncbi:MAG TPA: trehalose-phosphatase [Nocardioidaceae bacterium]|jgi:trehalose 6-phosphate phosphatase|nr:trehalose-phosphatase [Nocardioidaceae bacterium]
MELSPRARERYDAVVAAAGRVVVGLDYDGTLSPIVADPAAAAIHPDGPDVLVALAAQVRAVVVVTGRPAAQAVSLGGLSGVADRLPSGALLMVLGQYGHERWDSDSRTVTSPPPPGGLTELAAELPALLAAHEAGDAFVEDKGLALAVHTRRLPDAQAAFDRLRPVLTEAAERHGLHLEPGRMVLELRAPGMHKGDAVRAIAAELDAGALVFAGDDLGDVEAFRAVADLRDGGLADHGGEGLPGLLGEGVPGLLVCSGSGEQTALVQLADVVVDGPAGVLALLRQLTADLSSG